MIIGDSELSCKLSEPEGVGVGSGFSDTSGSLLVRQVKLRNTAVTGDTPEGVCIGIGNFPTGTSHVERVTIEGGRIASLSHGRTFAGDAIGGNLSNVTLDGTIVECGSVGPSCIQARKLAISNSIFGHTTTARFFDAASISWEDGIPVRVRYLNLSEFEGIENKRLLHLREIEYLYDGPYELFVDSATVEMDGSEDGLLISLSDSVRSGVSHRVTQNNEVVLGYVLQPDRQEIVFGTGETMVSKPIFETASLPYLEMRNPYTIKKRLIMLSVFTISFWF
jgi:hypothetical protein